MNTVSTQNGTHTIPLPPQNIDAEIHVLGALLLDGGEGSTVGEVSVVLQPEHFYRLRHRVIYEAIGVLAGEGAPIDLITVTNALRIKGKLDEAGGPEYVARLPDDVSSTRRAVHHAELVKKEALRRQFIQAGNAVVEDAYDPARDPYEIAASACRVFLEVVEPSIAKPEEVDEHPNLPREALYGVAGEIVEAVSPHSEADDAATLINVLAAFGNLVGSDPHFLVGQTRHGVRLSSVLVGQTSKGRKGTSWSTPKEILCRVDPEWKSRVVSGLSSGEGLIHSVRDERRGMVAIKEKGRITGYEEAIVDHGVDDKRLLVVEEEFASCLKVMNRDGNTLSPVIRQSWDSGDLNTLTKNTPMRATGAHITILAHVTSHELMRHLNSTESANGFANRFMWFLVRRSKCLASPTPVPEETMARLTQQLFEAAEFAREVGEITRDVDAEAIWQAIYPELSGEKQGLLGAVTSRGEAQTLRLSCVYALLDRSEVIRPVHLKAALAVWEYSEASARLIFGTLLGSPMEDKILDTLKSRGEVNETEISALFGKNKSADEIHRALSNLKRWGHAESREEKTPGRSRTVWGLTN